MLKDKGIPGNRDRFLPIAELKRKRRKKRAGIA